MTRPTRVGELLPGVLAEVVDRAGHGYDRWAEQVAAGRLLPPPDPPGWPGRARRHADGRGPHRLRPTGSRTRCCSRPAATAGSRVCPSCCGHLPGRRLPAPRRWPTRAARASPRRSTRHPRLFVTFTAPSLRPGPHPQGPRAAGLPCHPYRQGHAARTAAGMAAGSATTRTTLGWGSRCAPAATRPALRCCGTPSRGRLWSRTTICCPPGPGPLGRRRRGRSAAAGPGVVTPRWPSTSGAGRSTSTPSSAWTRPPTAAARAAWPRPRPGSPLTCSRKPFGRPPGRAGCPARPSTRTRA